MTMKIFKCEAEGDVVYVQAKNLWTAQDRFTSFMGEVPSGLLTWTEVDKLPKGEEFL
jgi:hypothetical protein